MASLARTSSSSPGVRGRHPHLRPPSCRTCSNTVGRQPRSDLQSSSTPRRTAVATASVRDETPSLSNSSSRCVFTVFVEMPSLAAICLLPKPSASNPSTCRSRFVRGGSADTSSRATSSRGARHLRRSRRIARIDHHRRPPAKPRRPTHPRSRSRTPRSRRGPTPTQRGSPPTRDDATRVIASLRSAACRCAVDEALDRDRRDRHAESVHDHAVDADQSAVGVDERATRIARSETHVGDDEPGVARYADAARCREPRPWPTSRSRPADAHMRTLIHQSVAWPRRGARAAARRSTTRQSTRGRGRVRARRHRRSTTCRSRPPRAGRPARNARL